VPSFLFSSIIKFEVGGAGLELEQLISHMGRMRRQKR